MKDLKSLNEMNSNTKLICRLNNIDKSDCINGTLTFWLFVILLSLGTICFNITNCISDAICFDVLGENQESQYGAQRVWGTIGFGLTALIAGIAVDFSTIDIQKSFTPAILLMVFFSCIDMYMIRHLTVFIFKFINYDRFYNPIFFINSYQNKLQTFPFFMKSPNS